MSQNLNLIGSLQCSILLISQFHHNFHGVICSCSDWLAAPNTIQGLEFGGLNLLDSIGEFVFSLSLFFKVKHMLGKILIKKKEKKIVG